ncbi:MAG: hypothetical protein EOP06_23960, partial [Proteobacteria bacterium]
MISAKIVGMGAVGPNGLNKEDFFRSVSEGRTNVGQEGLASLSELQWQALKELTPAQFQDSHCTVLSATALAHALAEASWLPRDLADCGFIFASTTSQIDQWEPDLPKYQSPQYDIAKIRAGVNNQSLGTPAIRLSERFKISGPRALIASSCSASLQALATAMIWIRTGRVRRCVVGATEIH